MTLNWRLDDPQSPADEWHRDTHTLTDTQLHTNHHQPRRARGLTGDITDAHDQGDYR